MRGIRRGLVFLAVVLMQWPAAAQEAAVEIIVEGDEVGDPFGVEMGPDGGLYVTDIRSHRVLRMELPSRRVTAVAGCGRKGYAGDRGPAIDAELNEPYEVRFDGDGHMYFVEMRNHVVRRVDAKTKAISTVAGTGRAGFGGDGGQAVEAAFNQPHSIALDDEGGLYIADIGNHRIRRVDLETGVVETIAGNGERVLPVEGQQAAGRPLLGPRALFVERGTLWIALREGHSIWKMDLAEGVLRHVAGTGQAGYTGDGGPAKRATFNGPKGIAVGADGDVYVVDSGNNAIRVIGHEGVVSTIVGGPAETTLNQPHGVCVGPDGAVYVGDTLGHRLVRAAGR